MHMNHLRFWSNPAPKHSSVIQRLLRVTAGVRLFSLSFGRVPEQTEKSSSRCSWCEFWRTDPVVIPARPASRTRGSSRVQPRIKNDTWTVVRFPDQLHC